VREALLEPLDEAVAPVRGEIDSVRSAAGLNGASAAGATAAAAATGAVAAGAASTSTKTVAEQQSPASAAAPRAAVEFDPSRPTPYDADAT